MIITIGKFKKNSLATFLLQKNPNAIPDNNGFIYVRKSNQYGEVKGKYIEKNNYLYFQLFNERTSVDFLDWARKQNMSNYNFIHKDSVCPSNLRAFDNSFKNIIQGDINSKVDLEDAKQYIDIPNGVDPDEFLKNELIKDYDLTANIAPFHIRGTFDEENIIKTFEAYKITATIKKQSDIDFAVEVELNAKMPIVEFFQKVYIISLYLTMYLDIPDYSKERITQQLDRIANKVANNWILKTSDSQLYEINTYRNFFIDEITEEQRNALLNYPTKVFYTDQEFKEAMLNIFGEDFIKEKLTILSKVFKYRNVFDRMVNSLGRQSRTFKEQFRLYLAKDEEEIEEVKKEFDPLQYGQLHRAKHGVTLALVKSRSVRFSINVDKYSDKYPLNKLGKKLLNDLSRREFNAVSEMLEYFKTILKPNLFNKLKSFDWINNPHDDLVKMRHKKLRIIDYGSGSDAKLTRSLKDLDYDVHGYDASKKALDRYRNTGFFHHMNILYPHLKDKLLNPDILLSIEVIEHLEENDRKRMLKIIRDVISPKTIILSTPNIEYNKFYENLRTKYRHRDHKIEYTQEQFNEEVVKFLEEGYVVSPIQLEPEKEIQQSFYIVCERKKDTYDNAFKNKLDSFYQDIYLPYSGYTISKNELAFGYASSSFIQNRKNIFYAGTTIAPVDYTLTEKDYLEHPINAVNYYLDRGVTEVVVEKKYMGSRAYILAFKNIEIANKLGFESTIIINSRGNNNFFENSKITLDSIVLQNLSKEEKDNLTLNEKGYVNEKDLEQIIYKDIEKFLTKDVMMFDAEIMPWSILGKGLIEKDFKAPVELSLLKSRLIGDSEVEAKKFINVLNNFSKETPLEIRLFGLIAEANIRTFTKKGYKERPAYESFKIDNIINGFNIKRTAQHEILNNFQGKYVKPVEGYFIDLTSNRSIKKLIKDWKTYCEKDLGEGFVIKTNQPIIIQKNGHLITPMLKVRGKEYLRLIYGYDMYNEKFFEILKKRSIRAKRVLSVHETEISMAIVNAFLRGHMDTKNHFFGAFAGIDGINYDNIDKTL